MCHRLPKRRCSGCKVTDVKKNANLYCSIECFDKTHRILPNAQRQQHRLISHDPVYDVCVAPFAACGLGFADHHCDECGITCCTLCMAEHHDFIKADHTDHIHDVHDDRARQVASTDWDSFGDDKGEHSMLVCGC